MHEENKESRVTKTAYLVGWVDMRSRTLVAYDLASEFPMTQIGTHRRQVLISTQSGTNFHDALLRLRKRVLSGKEFEWLRGAQVRHY
jgi:hypothetical protein